MQFFQVKNFDKFQHYKERNPPWIKVHRSIFDDYEFECLHDASKLHLMLIWVLASQCDNKIPADPEWLKRKLGVNGKIDLKPLIDKGFLVCMQDASNMPENADSETESETYKSTYKTDAREEWFEEDWASYPRKEGNKTKAKKCYLKSVESESRRKAFQKKMRAYVASVDDAKFLKHGETFFRNWEDLVISDLRPKNYNPNDYGEVRI